MEVTMEKHEFEIDNHPRKNAELQDIRSSSHEMNKVMDTDDGSLGRKNENIIIISEYVDMERTGINMLEPLTIPAFQNVQALVKNPVTQTERNMVNTSLLHSDKEKKNRYSDNLEQNNSRPMKKTLSEIYNQIKLTLALTKPWYGEQDLEDNEHKANNNDIRLSNYMENPSSIPQAEIKSSLTKLQSLFNVLELSKDCFLENMEKELVSAKAEQIEMLTNRCMELELLVSDTVKERVEMEKKLNEIIKESSETTKSLNKDLNSHMSLCKSLEKKAIELEETKEELELHLSEAEEENIQLYERISGLEAQLRHMTDERESIRLDLENSGCLVIDLQNEIGKLGIQLETQNVDLRNRLEEMQKQWSEAQEELEVSKRSNIKLQATIEGLIEECSSLQKINEELRRQRLEMHEHYAQMEGTIRVVQNKFSDCYKKAEILEAKLSSLEKDSDFNEKSLDLQLEVLLHEHGELKEKHVLFESLISHVQLEKSTEIENLQTELADLKAHVSSTSNADAGERIEEDMKMMLEMSSIRKEKIKLEASLQEERAKAIRYQNELSKIQQESEDKLQDLMNLLAASKLKEEQLASENDQIHTLLEVIKASEENLKVQTEALDSKLKTYGYDKQNLMEEIAGLKSQWQNVGYLQDEISLLKGLLNDTKFEKDKLETSFQLLNRDFEELKAERILLMEKTSSMERALLESEDARRSKIALEEKLHRLESDLTAKEALSGRDAELKTELSRMRRTNSQFQRRIQLLEEEKDEFNRKAQALEEEMKLRRQENLLNEEVLYRSSDGKNQVAFCETIDNYNSMPYKSEDEESNAHGIHSHEKKSFPMYGQQNDGHEREDDKNICEDKGKPTATSIADLQAKIQVLEMELAEALEANNLYKLQLKSLLSGVENSLGDVSLKMSETFQETCDIPKGKLSTVEAELKEMRERYYEMSLRFAEVQAEHEELAMKVSSEKTGKRWF